MNNRSTKTGIQKGISLRRIDSEDSMTEIKIDEVIDQVDLVDFVSFMDLNENRNKVFPSLGPDGQLRYSKFVEMPQQDYQGSSSWYKKCWRRFFQHQNDLGQITRSDVTNFKMRRMMNEFAYENKVYFIFQEYQENGKLEILQKYLSFIKVIEPKSYFYITWQIGNAIIVLILAFEVLFVCFITISLENNHYRILQSFIGFSIIIFIIDMIISFNTAYYVQGKLETNRFRIVEHYIKSELFFDIIPIISLTFQLAINTSQFYYTSPLFFLKLYELFKFQEQVQNLLRLHRRLLALWQLVQLLVCIILICHLFACMFYALGDYLYRQEDRSWFEKLDPDNKGQDFYSKSIPEKYIFAFYWSITTMVSVGYGDITPVLKEEVVLAVFSMFVSCILFAYSINYIWEVIREANESRYNFERFMYYNGVSRNLRTRINAYLAHMWEADRGRDTVMEQDMINRLGPELREELIFESMGLILQRCSIFSGFSKDFVKELAQDVEEVRYSEGEKIFSAWEPEWDDMSLYFILAGSVEIYLQKSQDTKIIQLQILRNQQTFGHIGFVGGVERTASAKCLTYSRIYKLSREDFLIRLESYPDDKQHFHELRSNLIFKNNFLGLRCFICESEQHIINNCDKAHLVILKDQLIYEENKQINKRGLIQRKNIKKFHSYKNLAYIQNEVRYAQRFFKGLSFHTRESESYNEDLENEQDQEEGHESVDLRRDSNDSRLAVQSPKDNLEQYRQTGTFDALKKTTTGSFHANFVQDNQLKEDITINNGGSGLSVGELEMEVPNFWITKKPSIQKQQPQKNSAKLSIDVKSNNFAVMRKFKSFDVSDEDEVFVNSKKKNRSFQKNVQSNLQQFDQLQASKETGMFHSQSLKFNRVLNRKALDINMGIQPKIQLSQKSSIQILIKKIKKLKELVHNNEGSQLLEQLQNEIALLEEFKTEDFGQNIKEKQVSDFQSLYSGDSEFSIDLLCNYENFFPQQNPQIVVKDIRKQQQKKRSQFFRRSKIF